MKFKTLFPLVLFFVFTHTYAQSNVLMLKEKIADKYFRNMSYMQAIATYEDILREDSANTRVLPNLAMSYRKVYDTYNARRIYARLVTLDSSNAGYALAYAQTLAIQQTYDLSAIMYQRYSSLNPVDKSGNWFSEAYANNTFLNKKNKVEVEIANFNSSQSDFSPAYYKNGLVFVSNRNYKTSIQRKFSWDQTSFLNLYYLKDTANIKTVNKTDTAEGKSKRRKIYYNDDDTRFTSNDSRTMNELNYKYVDTSNMFVTADVIVNDFSKNIKTKYHEGPMTFTADQKTIIFTRNNYNKGRAHTSDDGVNKLQLYSAHINNDSEWTEIKPLNINSDNFSVGHPALAPGDTILYYTSDMPGGYGGTDIYKSYWREEKWSTPENLGPIINTNLNEQFPYIDKEGTLYFSSDGHPGFGGLDLFKVSLSTMEVENMGVPVNSSYDDFGIVLDETTNNGFFSSNRRRGVNDDDIYKMRILKPDLFVIKIVDSITQALIAQSTVWVMGGVGEIITTDTSTTGEYRAQLWNQTSYTIMAKASGYTSKTISITTDSKIPVLIVSLSKPREGCMLSGIITDKESKQPIASALVVIINKETGDTLLNETTTSTGEYRVAGLKGNSNYNIYVSMDGYFTKPPYKFSTKGVNCTIQDGINNELVSNFTLEKIVVGKAIKIENIYFDVAKYNIRKDAAKELDKIVKLMQDNPDIIIELSSHTDCRASYNYNMTLSDNRAKASADYIISKGIASNRITGKGYGETKLVNDCGCEGKLVTRTCTEKEHQANRRTEFKVTGFLSDKNDSISTNGNESTTSDQAPTNTKEK